MINIRGKNYVLPQNIEAALAEVLRTNEDSESNECTTDSVQSITAVKTFTATPKTDAIDEATSATGVTVDGVLLKDSTVALSDGTVSDLSVKLGADKNNGIYGVSDTQVGIAVEGALVATADTLGLTADSIRNRVNLGTVYTGVTAVEYGDGRNITTVLTLSSFVVGALAGAGASLGVGGKIYTFPAGAHVYSATYMSAGLTATGTTNTPKIGIGSVIASGAVSVLSGTATFMDYLTEQTAADIAGTATVALKNPTAGVQTGIALNVAASVKDVFLNAAATWAANNTGNLTASGTITLKWVKMS